MKAKAAHFVKVSCTKFDPTVRSDIVPVDQIRSFPYSIVILYLAGKSAAVYICLSLFQNPFAGLVMGAKMNMYVNECVSRVLFRERPTLCLHEYFTIDIFPLFDSTQAQASAPRTSDI